MLGLYLVYSLSLSTNGVVIQGRAGRALVPRHVNTHQVQVLWQELQKQTRGGYGAGNLLRSPGMGTGDHGWEQGVALLLAANGYSCTTVSQLMYQG